MESSKKNVCIGIDVSKEKSTICFMAYPEKICKKPFDITHTREALDRLAAEIRSVDGEVKILMESTGHYHLPIVMHLLKQGLPVYVENALSIKRFSKIDLHSGKTDPLDSKMIARYGLVYWGKIREFRLQEDTYGELDMLARQYQYYIKLLVLAKQNVNYLMDRTLPGIKKALNSSSSTSFTKEKYADFARDYWHIDEIRKIGKPAFMEEYQKWCRKKGYQFSQTKAEELYHLAETGIASLPSEWKSTQTDMKLAVEQLIQTGEALNHILAQMTELAKKLPEYEVINQMEGVGPRLAVRMIADIGDVRRFTGKKALIAYAGIDAPPYQSGQFTGIQRKISKRGRSSIRKTGYEIMKSVKMHPPKAEPIIYNYIIKKEKEGKAKKQAKIAGLNKFLQIYYARVMEVYQEIA